MASSRSIQQRKQELLLSLDSSRAVMRGGTQNLRERINPVRRSVAWIRENPVLAFGGTAVGVAVLTVLLRPRRKAKAPKTFKAAFLGWALGVAKPAASLWLSDRVRTYIQTQHANEPPDSLLGP